MRIPMDLRRTPHAHARSTIARAALAASLLACAVPARAQTEPPPPDEPEAPEPFPATEPEPEPATEPEPEPAPEPATEPAPEAAPGPEAEKKKKKKKPDLTATEKRAVATGKAGMFGFKGRVLVELDLRDDDRQIVDLTGMLVDTEPSLDLELDSARFSLLYQAPFRWLQAEIEIEVADPDQVELRDAYMLAENHGLHAKAGNFKVPTSAIELESAWDLPMSRRGFINDLLEGWLDIAGRRPGLQLGIESRKGIEPKLMVGMFQGTVQVGHTGTDRDTELIEEAGTDSQSWAARGQIELGRFDIGVFFEHRVGSPANLQTQHYPVVGADIVFKEEFGDFGLRAWLDGHYGESWYQHANQPVTAGDPWLLAVRAIVGARYGGTKDEEPFGELFVSLGMLDPDLDVTDDWAQEITAGINGGLWDRARLTLEAYLNDTQRNFPASYFMGAFGKTLGLTLQAGVAF